MSSVTRHPRLPRQDKATATEFSVLWIALGTLVLVFWGTLAYMVAGYWR
jgi:hypothetical protein